MSHSPLADAAERSVAAPSPPGTRPRPAPLWVTLLAEGIGTFGLVFAGCGAIMVNTLSNGQITHVGVGLVFGLVVVAMIYATGHLIPTCVLR